MIRPAIQRLLLMGFTAMILSSCSSGNRDERGRQDTSMRSTDATAPMSDDQSRKGDSSSNDSAGRQQDTTANQKTSQSGMKE